MTALTGRVPKDTYKDLLQVSNSNSGIDTTLRRVQDGEGTNGALSLSTTQAGLEDGSGAAPGLVFRQDADTGIWRPGSNQIAVSVGGGEALRIDSGGRLLIGHTAAQIPFAHKLHVAGLSSSTAGMAVSRWSNDTGGAEFRLGSSRGTSVGDFTASQSGDFLGVVRFYGADGSAAGQAASIEARADGTPSADSVPGRIVFGTTAAGSSSPSERMRIDSAGAISFNSGSGLKRLLSATKVIDFGSIAAGASASDTITVTGATTGDAVNITVASANAAFDKLIIRGYVSATNTVTVSLFNPTGSAIDPPSVSFRATVMGF